MVTGIRNSDREELEMKLDRNGYGPSLFETEQGVCYNCGLHTDTARHEILHGPNRKNSKKYGCWINVCPKCHELIHKEDNGEYLFYKEASQQLFECYRYLKGESEDDARREWMALFGRNYL